MDAKLSKIVRRIEASVPHEGELFTAMRNQLGRVKIRTAAGRDVYGFPFLRKKDGSTSTLFKTGTLMRSLQASAGHGDRGLVGHISVTGRAREYAPFVNSVRKFLGASQDDRMDIRQDLKSGMHDRRSEQ